MSTLTEIETAAEALLPQEQEKLLLFLVEKLRSERGSLQPPREFSRETMQKWMHEDESDMKDSCEHKHSV